MRRPIEYSYGNCKKPSPCKNCKERALGCHDRCERYLEFKHHGQIVKDKVHNNKRKEANCVNFIIRRKKSKEY